MTYNELESLTNEELEKELDSVTGELTLSMGRTGATTKFSFKEQALRQEHSNIIVIF